MRPLRHACAEQEVGGALPGRYRLRGEEHGEFVVVTIVDELLEVDSLPPHHRGGIEAAAGTAIVAGDQMGLRVERVPVGLLHVVRAVGHGRRDGCARLVEEVSDIEARVSEPSNPIVRSLLELSAHTASVA